MLAGVSQKQSAQVFHRARAVPSRLSSSVLTHQLPATVSSRREIPVQWSARFRMAPSKAVHNAKTRSWTNWFERIADGWHPDTDLPDLSGKVALVTGGSAGLGFETAARLAEHNCKIYLVSSSDETAGRAAEKLRQQTGGQIIPIGCDMFSLRNVTAFLKDFRKRIADEHLDILFLNHGIFYPGHYQRTPEGFEQQLGVNYYSQALLALGLLDKLMEAAPSRIVFQASEAEAFGQLEWENLKGDKWNDSGMRSYGTSKLFQIMFAKALQEPLRRTNKAVDVFAVHPGLVNTPLMGKVDGALYPDGLAISLAAKVVGVTPARGALPGVYAAASAEAQGQGFKHFGFNKLALWPYTARGEANSWTSDLPACRRLFTETVRLLESSVGPEEWKAIEASARPVLQQVPAMARV